MKKNLFYLFALICALSLFSSCSDDDKKDEPKEDTSWKAVDGSYTGEKLKLTYNGQAKTGQITLAASSAERVKATLTNIIPGAAEVSVDMIMSKSTKAEMLIPDGYQLEGSTLIDSRTVSLKGSMDAGILTVTVTIKIDSKLVGKWGFAPYIPTDINGDGKIDQNDYNVMGGAFFLSLASPTGEISFGGQAMPDYAFCMYADQKADSVITAAAPELTFKENGNVGISFTKDGKTTALPETLLGYYEKDKMIYVTLDITALMGMMGKAEASDPLLQLMALAQNGIPLACETDGSKASILINHTLATSLLPVIQSALPILSGFLPEGSEGMLGQITSLLPMIASDKDFMVGINLVKK